MNENGGQNIDVYYQKIANPYINPTWIQLFQE